MGAVTGAVQDGDVVPRQVGAAVQERGLVGLDDKQVVGLLAGDQELGGVGVGVQRVGGDHGAGQVQVGQQRLESGHLAWRAVDLALGQHRTGGVVHRGQQVDLPAVAAFGAPQRLAVDRDRPPPLLLAGSPGAVTVGQPRAQHRRQRRWVTRARVRRMVASAGTTQRSGASRRAPSAARTGWGASAAHSAIAAIDRAPVKTAAAAMARIATRGGGGRRPAWGRGGWRGRRAASSHR